MVKPGERLRLFLLGSLSWENVSPELPVPRLEEACLPPRGMKEPGLLESKGILTTWCEFLNPVILKASTTPLLECCDLEMREFMSSTKCAEQGKPSINDLFSPVLMIATFFLL